MHRAALSFAVLALQLLGGGQACPFHAPDEGNTVANNHRRAPPGQRTSTAIDDIRVFDGFKFGHPRTVCLDDGYIAGTHGCAGAKSHVNGTGKFLIPGLIDNHLHLTDVQSLENFTSYGCTTAMHMNCKNLTQCEINANQPGLASFVRAGRSAVGDGGYHEAQDPTRPKDTLIYPDTDVAQFVRWQFGNGSDFHKITAEINGPSTQQQVEMVRVAHDEFQRQTMTHAASVSAYDDAAESATDGIQHVPDDGILANATIARIKAQGQFVTPTVNVFEYAYRNAALQQYFKVEPGSNRTLAHAETNARLLYQAGVPLVAGTDASGPMSVNGTDATVPYGLTLHQELQNLVGVVGMSPAEALNAATREAARWHRVPDRGSVEAGKRADLVMLNSNPLDDMANTLDIERVWALGIEVLHVTKRA